MHKDASNYDKEILVLQFFGISMVVLGHTGDGLHLFSDWFPYYSFHMMLFVFISGYLYKSKYEANVIKYIWKKMKHLILPFYAWLFVYGLITEIMKHFKWIFYGDNMTLENFWLYPWSYGCKYSFTAAWWFIPMLFLCQIVNVVIRKIVIKNNILVEYLYFLISVLLGLHSINIARQLGGMYGGQMTQIQMIFIKLMIVLPFFELGIIFKKYWKSYVDKMSSVFYLFIIFFIQLMLIINHGSNIEYGLVHLKFNSEPYVVYLASLTGILFWQRISKELINVLGNKKMVNLIGENTWTILLHHEFFVFLLQLLYIPIARKELFEGFSIKNLQSDYWYIFKINNLPQTGLIYTFVGIVVPLIVKKNIEKYILPFFKKILEQIKVKADIRRM